MHYQSQGGGTVSNFRHLGVDDKISWSVYVGGERRGWGGGGGGGGEGGEKKGGEKKGRSS